MKFSENVANFQIWTIWFFFILWYFTYKRFSKTAKVNFKFWHNVKHFYSFTKTLWYFTTELNQIVKIWKLATFPLNFIVFSLGLIIISVYFAIFLYFSGFFHHILYNHLLHKFTHHKVVKLFKKKKMALRNKKKWSEIIASSKENTIKLPFVWIQIVHYEVLWNFCFF